MLDETRTRQKRTREVDVLSTDMIVEPGLALTGVMEGGVMKSRRSNGVANTIFQGVSWITNSRGSLTIPQAIQIKSQAADSGGSGFTQIVLPYAATGTGDMLLLQGNGYGAGAPYTLAADKVSVDTATEYFVAGDNRTVYLTNANANKTFFVSYRYSPTVQQAYFAFGDNFLPKSSVQLGRIGILEEAQVYTSNYDTTVDWSTIDTYSASEALVAGVNGQFTVNKTGAVCPHCYVLEAPKVGSPYLGLYIHI
jgi:hypothetical protein